jgi:hypothetical protein
LIFRFNPRFLEDECIIQAPTHVQAAEGKRRKEEKKKRRKGEKGKRTREEVGWKIRNPKFEIRNRAWVETPLPLFAFSPLQEPRGL